MADEITPLPWWRTVRFAFLLSGLLLIVCVIPPINATILRADHHAAVALNDLVGRSPLFDRLLLLIADEKARTRVMGLVIAGFAFFVWRGNDRRERASRFALVVFLSMVLLLTLSVESYADELFVRHSPAYVLEPFRSLKRLYDLKISLKDRHSFPSPEALVLLLAGFTLLRMGRSRVGLPFLLAGLTLPVACCIAGKAWLSDVYLGALPVAFLATALIVETRLRRVEALTREAVLSAVDESSRFFRRRRHILDGTFRWAASDPLKLENAAKNYIRRGLARALNESVTTPPAVQIPLCGTQSIIRFIDFPDRRVTLRVYTSDRRSDAEVHRDALQLLAAHNVRCPMLLHYADDVRRHRAVFLAEEYVTGQCLRGAEMTSTHVKALATLLARLHSVHNPRWGEILGSRTESMFPVIIRRIERRIRLAGQGKNAASTKERDEVLAWFRKWSSTFEKLPYYNLTHGMLHRENIVFLPSGEYCLLDLATLHWGICTNDIAMVHDSIFRRDPDRIAVFDEIYGSCLSADDGERIYRFLPFSQALHYLLSTVGYSRRAEEHNEKKEKLLNRQSSSWEVLIDTIRNHPIDETSR